ncbi:hypothetical protein [Kribbella sp. NPDC048928]|uniref:hypothetical protein n=1 Tax=Kribbella sp. NPDC048928 TaxID=3364111 RepID=UPI003719438D
MEDLRKPRRLGPLGETVQKLYLLSGNECAFPGCRQPIISDNGTVVAQIVHIEAAMPGGERYNASMAEEDRRAFENLMVLCYPHHKMTDDVDEYPVDRMRQIKRDHERRYLNGLDRLVNSVRDWTDDNRITPPKNLGAFLRHNGLALTADELAAELAAVMEFAELLRGLTHPARQTLMLILTRGRLLSRIREGGEYGVLLQELEDASAMTPSEVLARVGQLEDRDLVWTEYEEPDVYGFNGQFVVASTRRRPLHPAWDTLSGYCDANGIELRSIVEDLRFDLLDDS